MLIYCSPKTKIKEMKEALQNAPASFSVAYFNKKQQPKIVSIELCSFLRRKIKSTSGMILTNREIIQIGDQFFVKTGYLPTWRKIARLIRNQAIISNFPIPNLGKEKEVMAWFFRNFNWNSWKIFDEEVGSLISLTPREAILCANYSSFSIAYTDDFVIATSEFPLDKYDPYFTLSGDIIRLFPNLEMIEEGEDYYPNIY